MTNQYLPLSSHQLQMCFPNASSQKVLLFLDALNKVLLDNAQGSRLRILFYLAQVGHESGELRYVEEIASGSAYEGRLDLGNTQPGDGRKYKGRGLIQVTGKRNYTLCGLALDLPLLESPELLSTPANAVSSSAWFFSNNNLWSLCDKGDFQTLTKRINGGLNGMADRLRLLENCKKAIPE